MGSHPACVLPFFPTSARAPVAATAPVSTIPIICINYHSSLDITIEQDANVNLSLPHILLSYHIAHEHQSRGSVPRPHEEDEQAVGERHGKCHHEEAVETM
jgi:hypothetical protein